MALTIRAISIGLLLVIMFGMVGTINAQTTPGIANIYFEANTLVPTFYRGRAEPTVGSNVRAVAIVENIPANTELYYRWTAGQKVVNSNFTVGLNAIEIPINYSDSMLVSVEVRNRANQILARGSELLELSEPSINFHEDNPLRGVSRIAANDGYIMTADEASFRAEPYFMDRDVLVNSPRLEWNIDGQATRSANEDQQTITLLRTAAGVGQTRIGFYLHNTRHIIQYAQNEFVVKY